MNFNQLGLIDPILKALKLQGYETPTPIQEKAIPSILNKQDILGCAQTGTGKTAAFSIPMLQLLTNSINQNVKKKHIRALILTPTRELAIQIEESISAYGKFLPLKHTVIFGGVSQGAQVQTLQRGIDILVATPGRLLDLQQQGYVHLDKLEFFVLDEADRMLDMGFIHDVKRVLKLIPEKRQTLFFSATMPDEIKKLSSSMLSNPFRVEVTPVSSTAETIQQEVYYVEKGDKKHLLHSVLLNRAIKSALVFTRTKHGANKVVKDLLKQGISAEAIHGNKTQNARQKALKNFKGGTTRVLVATDIAARGIDIDQLSQVINYEIPNVPETYVHRIGRTGRAGASGAAMSFCDEEETSYIRDIERLIKISIPVNESHEWDKSKDFQRSAPIKKSTSPQARRSNESKPYPNNTSNNKRRRNPNRNSHSAQKSSIN